MDLRLRGKVIIVTGGTSGIGESICRKLAAEGAISCIVDNHSGQEAIEQIQMKFGRIDGLVNNAGINDGITNQVLPALKKTMGSIVNICSKTALTGHGGTSGYAAANGERLALTKQWSGELSPFGIHVNAVVVAECQMATPVEVANTVLFLLSKASRSINGQFISVDGV